MKTISVLSVIVGLITIICAVQTIESIVFILVLILGGLVLMIDGLLSFMAIPHGYIFRLKSFWWGLHYSDYNNRYCLNLLPGFTIWWTGRGGKAPAKVL